MDLDLDGLIRPISQSAPCGVDLEESQLLASFDGLRVFGQLTPLGNSVDWRALHAQSEKALAQSKDLRPLAYLGASTLRLSGLEPFVATLDVAQSWLTDYWEDVYPRVDEDAILRQNSLAAFADRMAIIDALRRSPLVSHSQLGAFGLRDAEIASGELQPSNSDTVPASDAQIAAAFASTELETCIAIEATVARGVAAAKAIEAVMRQKSDGEAVPDLDLLTSTFQKMLKLIAQHLEPRRGLLHGDGGAETDGAGGAGRTIPVGAVRNRQDAMRALDTVAEFFRRNEPSSPVPLFVERAKRLITMDFVQLLGDIAPGALPEAKHAAGLRDAE